MSKRKIVVLTPVKNEGWILERFLASTSYFADLIVIADQNSTDDSRSIVQGFKKTHLVINQSQSFNEAERQLMLISAARAALPGEKILLALDADEIMAANAMEQPGWQTMLAAPLGTTLYFEKPELYPNPARCIRWDTPWPIGYVDDGTAHIPKSIHSIRIPNPPGGRRLVLNDVKVMHYALCRSDAQRAKARYYSVLENVLATQPLRRRLRTYEAKAMTECLPDHQETPSEWLDGWEQKGIDMLSIPVEQFYWHDFEVLRQFNKYGTRRFWMDDIWGTNWEACRSVATTRGISEIPSQPIKPPPGFVGLLRTLLQRIVRRPRPRSRPR